ncbi:MAG: hypothetical protein FJ293_11375, partial [Planctomycetes bacterium]|nr:hypothetical protein [Planctomycetota bacterium]
MSALLIGVGAALVAGAGLLASRPSDVDSATRRANQRLEQGDGYGALEDLDRALAQLPPDDASRRQRRAELLLRRGDCHLALGRNGHALADYREAQQLAPGDWVAWERVGRARLEQQDFAGAALQFEEAAAEFLDRARWFRHAAGAAYWRASRSALEAAESDLEPRARAGQRAALLRALERHAAAAPQAPERAEIEREFLLPAAAGAPTDLAFDRLADARRAFAQAEAALADYDLGDGLELAYGVVRAEMHLQAGRTYELRRLVELLRRLPGTRDTEESARLLAALASGLTENGLTQESMKALETLRVTHWRRAQAAESGDERSTLASESYRTWTTMVRGRLERRQSKEAELLLADLAPPAPNHLQNSFFRGYCDHLLGLHDRAEPLLERCATLLIAGNGRHWQLRTLDDRLFVMNGVIEGLAAAGRAELAAEVIGLALDIAPDPAPLLERRITLLRPLREHLPKVVADGFALLHHGRGDGNWLPRFEEDWKSARTAEAPLEASVAEQAERVRRVYGSGDAVVTPALRELALMALGDRKHKTLPASALKGASAALLGDLTRDPGLALQVWRALIRSGDRDQAYLLLYGLAADHPRILEFRFLLARHEIGEGRLADAATSLSALVAEAPRDADIVLTALQVALDRGDRVGARALAEQTFTDGATPLARRVAATLALAHGQLDLAQAATGDGAELGTRDARALAGLAA